MCIGTQILQSCQDGWGSHVRSILSDDIDVFDDRDVEWAIATRFQADRGLIVLHDVRGSSIDPSANDGITAKVGIHATRPWGAKPEMFDKRIL